MNIKNNPGEIFELYQPHLVDKIISYVCLIFSARIKRKETLVLKLLLNKAIICITRKGLCYYRYEVVILSCLQGLEQTEMLMPVHQCTRFRNSMQLMHECAVICVERYLSIKYTYMDLSDITRCLSTCGVVYKPKTFSVTPMPIFLVGRLNQVKIMVEIHGTYKVCNYVQGMSSIVV